MVHLVLEYLGEQSGGAAGEFFSFFVIGFHGHFFGSCDYAENASYAKTALLYGLLFLRNFRNFGIYEGYDFSFSFFVFFFLGFLLILLRFYFPYILSKQ